MPMYIARAPSSNLYRIQSRSFVDLPIIQPEEAAMHYRLAYPDTPFRAIQGSIGQFNRELANELNELQHHTTNVIQRPWHDAELALFVFLIFLLRAKPSDSEKEDEDQLGPMQELYTSLRAHRIGAMVDARAELVNYTGLWWRNVLHKDLHQIAPYLEKLVEVLQPDYEFLIPTDSIEQEVVLHEILQCLLFEFYYSIKCGTVCDTQFDSKVFRPIKICGDSMVTNTDKPSASRYSNEGKRKREGRLI
ncbi:hypothetical protein VKT23_006360 [Stygiomarasmius scandens]|uniref:Uncharacterized protein n=1 Tax=Marasmiellus scandens TaxID=2682957 RepID=A0ABR1JN77_9AGAR